MTCHDPHRDADRSVAFYNARRLGCHSAQRAEPALTPTPTSSAKSEREARPSTCLVKSADGCIGCHLPTIRNEPLHASFADHYIRVHPSSKQADAFSKTTSP